MFIQLTRFGITGLLNTILDFGLFNLLIMLVGKHDPLTIALINIIAVSAAMANSFYLNRNWTFASVKAQDRRQYYRFIIASLCGLAINTLSVSCVSLLLEGLYFSPYVHLNGAKILSAVLSSGWNFWSYRNWVFPPTKEDNPFDYTNDEYICGLTSIIIPAYNEMNRLPARLQKLAAALPAFLPFEIIVVDDGSSDNTSLVVRSLAEKYPAIRYINYPVNQGKGKAVQTGMQAARGEYLLYTDADDTFTPEHIQQVIDKLQAGSQIVIACRALSENERMQGESSIRRLMGRVFNMMVQSMIIPGIKDTQCGLKGFRREIAVDIFKRQRIQRFAFDVELLALARALEYKIDEHKVEVVDCQGSTVNRILSPLQMVRDLFFLKIALMTNSYSLPGRGLPMQNAVWGLSLFLVALTVRIPWLWEVPRFIDELKEVNLAYMIYSAQAFPLHNAAHDIGAMHNYILAGIFKLLGPGIYWPRLYVAITSALTVVLVYQLGKKLFGHITGLIAAGLLLTNGMHILVTHMAWANCTTPFFFTLALMATLIAEQKPSGRWLVMAALLWAAALQTHSSVIIYIVVVLIYILRPAFRQKTRLSPQCYLAAAAVFTAGYSNMLYYNLISKGGSFKWLTNKSYALETDLGLSSYLENMQAMFIELIRSLSSSYTAYETLWPYLQHPFFVICILLMVMGSYFACQEKKNLPLWLILGGFIIIPLLNERYVFFLATRYIMPLIICATLLLAFGFVRAIRLIYHHSGQKNGVLIASAVFVFLSISGQLLPYYTYCSTLADTNESNRMALEVLNVTKQTSDHHSMVMIDDQLPLENQPLPYLLTILEQRYQVFNRNNFPQNPLISMDLWDKVLRSNQAQRLIMIVNDDTFRELSTHLNHEKVTGLSCKITFPTPSPNERKIYVIEINQADNRPVFNGLDYNREKD